MLVFINTNDFSQVENLSFTTIRDYVVFKGGKYYLSILQKILFLNGKKNLPLIRYFFTF